MILSITWILTSTVPGFPLRECEEEDLEAGHPEGGEQGVVDQVE